MKRSIFIFVTILLMTGNFSCSQNEGNEESGKFSWSEKMKTDIKGNTFYEPCPCEEDRALWKIQKGDVTMFIIENEEQRIESDNKYPCIVFNKKEGIATLYFHSYELDGILVIGKICNFPDVVKEWDITEKGRIVYFEGILYLPCKPVNGVANFVSMDVLLTSLKRK